MPSGSWNNKGVSIQSSDLSDAGCAYQTLYQPVVKSTAPRQPGDGFSLETHHFMDLSQVLREVEDEGSLIPSPTRSGDRKRRLSDDSPEYDHDGYATHASIEQLKNAFSISLDSLNENNVDSTCSRYSKDSPGSEYDCEKTPTVNRSFWSTSGDGSPGLNCFDSHFYDDADGIGYERLNIAEAVLETPTNLNTFVQSCDLEGEKEIRNIGVVTDDYELNNDLVQEFIGERKSCSSQDGASSASSESLRSAYSLQTPALSSSPESYDMLYRSFEVAAMMEKEQRRNGVTPLEPPQESSLDILNKTSPKLQRMSNHRGGGKTSSCEASPSSPLASLSRSSGTDSDSGGMCRSEHRTMTLEFTNSSMKAQSAEDISSSKVTFAQIAQQRRKPEWTEEKKDQDLPQENLLHWTELLSFKDTSSDQTNSLRPGPQRSISQHQTDAPRRPQSLPIQLRHLQKPTCRPQQTPQQHQRGVTRTLSAPEGFSNVQRTSRSWGEHDEGIGELSETEGGDELSPDPIETPPPSDHLNHQQQQQHLPSLLRKDEIEFGSQTPRRHRTITWCGSFASNRRSLLGSRELISDTDSLDSWQPRSTDINANITPNCNSPSEGVHQQKDNVSVLYDACNASLAASLCRKNFLINRDNVHRTQSKHLCKDAYAERMLEHGGVFISGTESKPFLLQDIDSNKPRSGAAAGKSHSLPRNLGAARRRNNGAAAGGRSRPKSMEGLTSYCKDSELDDLLHSLTSQTRSKSPIDTWHRNPAMTAGVSAIQQQWNDSDRLDYASLDSYLLGNKASKQTRVTCEELLSSSDESDLFPSSRRIIRIDNVAKDAEVKYIKHRPLKPIHVVDAEHHRKKVLERLSNLQPPSSAPPTGGQPEDWQSFPHPTNQQPPKGHRRQKSDVSSSSSQSQARRDGFWAWASSKQPTRAKNMSNMEDSILGQGRPSEGGPGGSLRDSMRPLHLKTNHDEWDALESMPPQEMRVSPREEENSGIDVMQKRALVAEVNSAVDQLLAHFAQARTRQPQEKARLGDSWKTPDIGHLVLHYLCPAFMRILQDGLKPYSNSFLVGRIKNTTWTTIEATTQIGPGTRLLSELASTLSKDIRLKDGKLRTNAFIVGLLNIRCMETWLEHIRSHPDIIKRLYEPTAFFSLCYTAPFSQLFSDLLVAIQPLAVLPFNLDHGFEYGYIQAENMRQRDRQQLLEQHRGEAMLSSLNTNNLVEARQPPEGGSVSSGFPTVHLFGRAPKREGAKTVGPAADGGPLASWNFLRSTRRVTPLGRQESSEQPVTQGGLLRTVDITPVENVADNELDSRGDQVGVTTQNSQSRWSLSWIREFATSVAAQSDRTPPRTTRNGHVTSKYNTWSGARRRHSSVETRSASSQGMSTMVSSGWGKLGASFSKVWNQVMPSQNQSPPAHTASPETPPTPHEMRGGADGHSLPRFNCTPTSPRASPGSPVKTLCHHVTMTEGELSFTKGDILTVNRQVDQDWLLCSHGNETGLVHIEYVQGME